MLVHGALHSIEERFDTGRFRGKRALICVTTGATATESGADGKEGDIDLLLWPTAYTLRYLGFDIYQHAVLHGVHGYFTGDEKAALERRLTDALTAQHDLIADLPDRSLIPFNADDDFDQTCRLRADRPSYSPFIRHKT